MVAATAALATLPAMSELSEPIGIVALAAAAVALIALLLALVLAFRLRRLRRAQTVVMGDGSRDLVEQAARLETGFTQLRDWVEETMQRLDQRAAEVDGRLDSCLSHAALVRYDAYGEMSGRQSSSFALLDERRSGIVVSSILHRDQARIYVKQLHEGESEHDLSPEEREAIETAFAVPAAPAARV